MVDHQYKEMSRVASMSNATIEQLREWLRCNGIEIDDFGIILEALRAYSSIAMMDPYLKNQYRIFSEGLQRVVESGAVKSRLIGLGKGFDEKYVPPLLKEDPTRFNAQCIGYLRNAFSQGYSEVSEERLDD